ncbi:fungal-specific transcription factor domain-containing protein [Phellopilus nigrolimitatus]|nr:fungal-specific transcription factor domain-containing protein [Phellopilus nigrolimitatus]
MGERDALCIEARWFAAVLLGISDLSAVIGFGRLVDAYVNPTRYMYPVPVLSKALGRPTTDDATRQREQELRRARGEIACVECQRLKLRCDRKVPCASCIRRNRAAMCPNGGYLAVFLLFFSNYYLYLQGHAWSDHETRSLLSDTAQLHRKLSEMSQRIRQLEDALEISHSTNSSSSHPLLREELLAIKRGIGPPVPPVLETEPEGLDGDTVEAMGTMSISERGVSRFIGRTGGGESLLFIGSDTDQCQGKVFTDELFPQLLSRRSDAWLLMPPNNSKAQVLAIIESYMPPFMRASSLCETYLENFSWIMRVAERPQIFEELLPCCYRRGGSNATAQLQPNEFGETNAHELALLLMIFATGALADLTLPPYNDEGERYYQMALAALSVTQVIGAASLPAVQAVALMAVYNAHCGRNNTLDLAGSLFNLAANLGISMGLHRDVAKWNVCTENADRRRQVFWEIFTIDIWHNIANGKPPSFVLRYCDCKYPEGNAKYVTKDGRTERSYWMDRHEFSRLTYAVSDLFSGVQPVRYAQILELDRKISEHIPPSHLLIPPDGSSMEEDGPLLIMQRTIPVVCANGLFMFIHRGFFAKALLEHPKDPLLSPYAHSYLSAHRSALSLLKVIREHYTAFPHLVSRFWSLWSHAFSATVIIGSIVIKSRNSDTARAALVELNLAVGLFEKAAQHSDRAKRSLPTLLRLREKAYNSARSFSDSPAAVPDGKAGGENEDELLIFTGKNRLFKPKVEHHDISLSTPMSAASALTTASSMLPLNQTQSDALPTEFSQRTPVAGPSSGQSQSHNSTSPSDTTMPATPATPDIDPLAMNADLPSAWSAWSDQEALLINYLSSGADLSLAQSAAFAGEPDPSAFMWAEMSHANSPDAPGTDGASRQQRQGSEETKPGIGLDRNGGFGTLYSSMDAGEPSSFVQTPEGGIGQPSQTHNQFPMQTGTTPWDTLY